MKKYEYKKVVEDSDIFESVQQNKLRVLGEEGWELVAALPERSHYVLYFKREINQLESPA